jgi:hypothetical protein
VIFTEEGGPNCHRVRSTSESCGPREDTGDDQRDADAPAITSRVGSLNVLVVTEHFGSFIEYYQPSRFCRSILVLVHDT